MLSSARKRPNAGMPRASAGVAGADDAGGPETRSRSERRYRQLLPTTHDSTASALIATYIFAWFVFRNAASTAEPSAHSSHTANGTWCTSAIWRRAPGAGDAVRAATERARVNGSGEMFESRTQRISCAASR
jgi:hypothetical protein